MQKVLFNTGVKPWNNSYTCDFTEWINNERHIAFYVEKIPYLGTLKCLCNEVFPEFKKPGFEVVPIIGGGMCSKYAVFVVPTDKELLLTEFNDHLNQYRSRTVKKLEAISEWEIASDLWLRLGRKEDAEVCKMLSDAIKEGYQTPTQLLYGLAVCSH